MLCVFKRAHTVVAQQLVALQVIVETEFLVGGEVTGCTLVLLF